MLLKLQEAANYIESPDRETILDPNLQATLWGSSSHCHPGQRKAGFGFISSPLPSSFRALAYQPHQDRREEEGWRRDGFLVLNLWKLPGRDWRGGDWELVPPKYICWPPLVTLEKRWFWVFSSIFVSPTKLLGFSGEGFGGHHKKTVQQFLAGSREHLWDSHHLGKSKGGRKLHRFSCKPFPILSPLPTIFPQRSGQSPEKKKHVVKQKKKKENKKKKCVSQPVSGQKATEKMTLERGDPVAKKERELPDLTLWMTIGDTDKMASNLRCHPTTKGTSQPSERLSYLSALELNMHESQ